MNYTDITAIIDRSESMAGLQQETIGGFNSFLEHQQELAKNTHLKVNLQVVQFDDQYEPGVSIDVRLQPKLNTNTYQPRGMTALLDAIGKTINGKGQNFANMAENERPEKILFLIITDGFENSSKEFQLAKIKEMLTEQQTKYKWDFIYLGANQDAWGVGSTMGFTSGKTLNVGVTGQAVMDMYASASSYTRDTIIASCATEASAKSFTAEDIKKQEKEGAVKNSQPTGTHKHGNS